MCCVVHCELVILCLQSIMDCSIQDGAPPHYANIARDLLNNAFPGRWTIWLASTQSWPHSMWFLSMGFGERSGLHTWTTNNRRAWRCHTWCDSKCPRWIFKESCFRRDTTVLTKAYRKWRWLCGSAITNRQDGNYLMSTDCNFIIHLCLLYLHL